MKLSCQTRAKGAGTCTVASKPTISNQYEGEVKKAKPEPQPANHSSLDISTYMQGGDRPLRDVKTRRPTLNTQPISNESLSKRHLCFTGIVIDSSTRLQGIKVETYSPDGKLLIAMYTDEDGWYAHNYNYTRKAARYTIKPSDRKLTHSVTVNVLKGQRTDK